MTSSPPPRRPEPPPASRSPRPGRARETIEVPRAVLAVLAGALLVSLLLIAFLVGRESGRRASHAARVLPSPPTADRDAGVDEDGGYDDEDDGAGSEEPQDWTAPAETSTPSLDPWPAAQAPEAAWPPRESTSESSPRGPGPESAAVAAYFTELEGYEQGAKYWNNPQELAMRLVGQGTQGDTSGFRQLVETQREAQRQIETMTVPLPCREHHRRTLEVMGQALRLLEKLESGVASGNLEGLLSLTGESSRLESDAREVDALAAELKREYGV